MGRHTPIADQRRLVSIWRASGDAMAPFARSHGIHPTTFRLWVCRCREAPEVATSPAFLEVVPREPESSLVVEVGPHALRFATPPPPDWFAAVVRGLARC